jgi:hypothetical protein
MLFLTLALLSAPSTCTEIKQQCRACPTAPSVNGCSTVGIACQPTRRICDPAVPPKSVAQADRVADKKAR